MEKGEHNTIGLYFHSPLATFTGHSPYFVRVRTDPSVDRFVAVNDPGTEVRTLSLRGCSQFALHFAATGIPTIKEPHWPIIEVQDTRPNFTDRRMEQSGCHANARRMR